MTTLNLDLLDWQQEVYDAECRFKVVAAGRRVGKSRLALTLMIVHAMNATKGWTFYVAPTQGQARQIMWRELLSVAGPLIKNSNVNNLDIELLNGQMIGLRGADRPDTMRGISLNYLVIDEYADIKADVWDEILRPACADQSSGALFIGTPKGRNHFYDMFLLGQSDDIEWSSWQYVTADNPFVPKEEIASAKRTMPTAIYRQEFEAKFESKGGAMFKQEWFKYGSRPEDSSCYVAIDLAGFGKSTQRRPDNSAISVVYVNGDGWFVEKIYFGRWELKETAEIILSVVEKYRPLAVGIERGIAKQAVMSPLNDIMRRNGRYFQVQDLTHGNQRKTDRIMWALQGRFEHGYITFNEDSKDTEWHEQLVDELSQFPDVLTHDDLVDALAYIDQLAEIVYHADFEYEYEGSQVLDATAGY
tara:strand:- start:4261 stop:5511 length:1251 start_codon:yes stop_codon:yes gene_type:complete